MLNSLWLQTFIKLAETGHFTQTANQLNMTQPGVSQHLKKLEQQVGAPLIIKIGKGFELTREGDLLLAYAQNMVAQEGQLRGAIHQDDPSTGTIRIACSGSMALYLYPKLLSRQHQYRDLAINLEVAPNQRILQLLLENQIDVGVVTQQINQTTLQQEVIGTEPLCLIAPASANLANPTLKQLDTLGFIDHPDGQHYAERLLSANYSEYLGTTGQRKVSGYINQLNQILVPVAQGLGYTVLPEMALRSFGEKQKLQQVKLKVPVSDTLYLTTKRYKTLPARYQWFLQEIKRLCKLANGGRPQASSK